MSAIKAILSWVFSNAIVFVLIVAALIAHTVWSQGRNAERAQESAIANELASLDEAQGRAAAIRREAEKTAADAEKGLADFENRMRNASLEALKRERTATEKAMSEVSRALPSPYEGSRQLLARDTEAMRKTALAKINLARLERQHAFLDESIAIARHNGQTLAAIDGLRSQLDDRTATLEQLEQKCRQATRVLQAFNGKWFGPRWIGEFRGELRELEAAKTKVCHDRDIIKRINSLSRAVENGTATINTAVAANLEALEELERQSEERQAHVKAQRDAAQGELGVLAERYELARKARSALLILLALILMPFLIRTFFYYVLAPLAERRASIRITVPGNVSAPLLPMEPSRISLSVALGADEELLVRQDYLQTSSIEAEKATRWLLDYRHPLSSIASGLFFLTRLRGSGSTTVSAVRDPFAELARIDIPQGGSCVLHPRALVALIQPIGQTMRITSHWRLFSLNAWLTMQLRFIVFHGPGCLVVRGGRGVRVEPAAAGRIFGQNQLVGFSADLAYSVTRTETFAPYFFGREQLFKDKVEQGAGVLIIEEAPFAGRQGGEVRRGLEGAFDAGMKAFGL